MGRKPRSLRQEQQQLADEMRSRGCAWPEIAGKFRETYNVNARAAFRLAHGWSQREASDQWNARWPADPKTLKNFSYWETWPAASGYEPSLAVLTRLAELYECSVADLLVDGPDFRARDSVNNAYENLAAVPALLDGLQGESRADDQAGSADLAKWALRLEEMDMAEITQTAAVWAQRLESTGIDRRALLLKLAAGISVAATTPALAPEPAAAATGTGQNRYEGVWLSRYVYHSSTATEDLVGEHYVVLRSDGTDLIGESLPHTSGSKLRLELSVDGPIVSGTWTEHTSPTGHYKGAVYHGTLQMMVDPLGRSMEGQWVGFGKKFKVNNGEWSLTWVDGNLTKRAIQKYHLAV
ncbi:hypothetical protein [Fodinicola acaciae]|uniref:hypothetical protein n=1 Tax=Fodinicola acaciae TaxID=2681555 RepID=UPI0013D297E8|nr:hypothetical protein [Fodinicola acaciae]